MRRVAVQGFTLLEMLIAVSIFALVSVMAYGGLKTILKANDHLEGKATRFGQLQQFFLLIQQDLVQATPRIIRDEFGDYVPAFIGKSGKDEPLLSLSRSGVTDLVQRHSVIRRVDYVLKEGSLIRKTWPVLDRIQATEPRHVELLNGVSSVSFEYYLRDWHEYWPLNSTETWLNRMPRAIRINLELDDIGTVQRTFPVTL